MLFRSRVKVMVGVHDISSAGMPGCLPECVLPSCLWPLPNCIWAVWPVHVPSTSPASFEASSQDVSARTDASASPKIIGAFICS